MGWGVGKGMEGADCRRGRGETVSSVDVGHRLANTNYTHAYVYRVVRVKTMLCKMVGVVFTVAAGLPAGKEGPMVRCARVVLR